MNSKSNAIEVTAKLVAARSGGTAAASAGSGGSALYGSAEDLLYLQQTVRRRTPIDTPSPKSAVNEYCKTLISKARGGHFWGDSHHHHVRYDILKAFDKSELPAGCSVDEILSALNIKSFFGTYRTPAPALPLALHWHCTGTGTVCDYSRA